MSKPSSTKVPVVTRAERYAKSDRLECGVRVVAGEQPPLTSGWTHGLAELKPGEITLTPYIGGVRLLRRSPVSISVRSVLPTTPRTVGLREAFAAAPGMALIRLHTGSATLEMVLHPGQVEWATSRLETSA